MLQSQTTQSEEELKKIELEDFVSWLGQELVELEDLILALEGFSNSLQAIIDRDKLKRSADDCNYFVETVNRFSQNALNQGKEIFICLQKEAQNVMLMATPN